MKGETEEREVVVRLRRQGGGVVMSIPQPVRTMLALKVGDIVVVRCKLGTMVARKVDLRAAVRGLDGDET